MNAPWRRWFRFDLKSMIFMTLMAGWILNFDMTARAGGVGCGRISVEHRVYGYPFLCVGIATRIGETVSIEYGFSFLGLFVDAVLQLAALYFSVCVFNCLAMLFSVLPPVVLPPVNTIIYSVIAVALLAANIDPSRQSDVSVYGWPVECSYLAAGRPMEFDTVGVLINVYALGVTFFVGRLIINSVTKLLYRRVSV